VGACNDDSRFNNASRKIVSDLCHWIWARYDYQDTTPINRKDLTPQQKHTAGVFFKVVKILPFWRNRASGYLQKLGEIKMSNNLKALLVLAGLLAIGVEASAALPASVDTTLTTIGTDMQSMFDKVFPYVATGVGLTIVLKLFKRFSNKI